MVASPILHREVHRAAVGRPLRRALAIVNHRSNFAAVAAVGVHHPDVRVFHGRLTVGQAAFCAAINDVLAVRRPQRLVLVVFGRGQAANAAVRHIQRENVIVEKLVLIWLVV